MALYPDAGWDDAPMDLYAIVSQRTYKIIWSDFTTASRAQAAAIQAAVNGGNCQLLSGADLAKYLLTSNDDVMLVVHDGTGTVMDVRECRFVPDTEYEEE